MMIVLRRWRSMTKPSRRQVMMVTALTKIILDHVVHIQISFGILDDRKLERLQRSKRNRSGREDQLRRRRSWGRSSDARRRWRRGQWNRHRRVVWSQERHGKV